MEKGNPPAYSPPQPGFNAPPGNSMYPPLLQQPPQQQMPQSNTVIVHQAVLPMMLGPKPTTMVCPSCHAQITSTVQTEATTKTHLFALLLCLFAMKAENSLPQEPLPQKSPPQESSPQEVLSQEPASQEPPQVCSLPPPYSDVNPSPPVAEDTKQTKTVVKKIVRITFGPEPASFKCPYCREQITTNVKTEPTTATHLWAVCLCILGGLMCVWIPYCIDSCQGRTHYCPKCNAYLGRYEN
ncbi:uncharacterized protein isoform X2 [Leptinotarsa decemlineata]